MAHPCLDVPSKGEILSPSLDSEKNPSLPNPLVEALELYLGYAIVPSEGIHMDRERYHKYMYLAAAVWNWILAIVFLTLPRIDMSYFMLAGDTIPPTMLWFDCFMGLVFGFGIGFYLISRSTAENHGLVQIAIFEKCWVFVIGLYYFLLAEASLLVLGVVTGDLIFGLLFLEDLLAIKGKQ